ncbi:MAG TPA: ferredoxin [Verrucomicrobiales bacterium]|nr:ferredoxin [Verrucomicrobiales bacterium]
MSNLADRFFRNVPGPFYNDDTCIDCGLCPEIAPGIFRRDDEHGQSYVWHQPETDEEHALAREAVVACPTESIGGDGVQA